MSWQPTPDLPDYQGPYPLVDLLAARKELIQLLSKESNVIIEKLKPKIGIASKYGPAVPLKPVVLDTPVVTQSSPIGGAAGFNFCSPVSPVSRASVSADKSSSPGPSDTSLKASDSSMFNHSLTSTDDESEWSFSQNGDDSNNSFESLQVERRDPSLRYKCDYCSYMGEHVLEVQDHLHHTQHQTASRYRIRHQEGGSIHLQAIVKRMAVKNSVNPKKSLLVVCPKCKSVFTDIFTCGMHTRLTHAVPQDCYAVCPVVKEQPLRLWRNPAKCSECLEVFSSHSLLHDHWNSLPGHSPVPAVTPKCTFPVIVCKMCPHERIFLRVVELKSHLLTKHNLETSSTHFTVHLQYILDPKQVDYLPHNDEPCMNGQRKDFQALREMKNKLRSMGIPREEKMRIKKELKDIRVAQRTKSTTNQD